MRRISLSDLIFGIAIGSLALLPRGVSAAELSFKLISDDAAGNGAAVVEARIDSQEKDINAIDGIISLVGTGKTDISSVGIETGGSVLTFWPVPPQYSPTEKVIRFTGGVPNGFDREGPLFRMHIFTSSPGDVTISWIGGSAYLNDGKGTREGIYAKSIVVSLAPQNQSTSNGYSYDKTPPNFDSVLVGRDPNTYGGRYFVSFHAIDDISGVARYEVREGQAVTSVANGVYVFKDQTMATPVFITAYDQAGNSKTVTVGSPSNRPKDIMITALFAVILIILFAVFRYGHKRAAKR